MSRYRFGERIGGGGMAHVRQAALLDDDGNVTADDLAVKFMKDELLAFPAAKTRFIREVRLQGELRHPNVMPIVGRGLQKSPPWFVMLRADRDLDAAINDNKGDIPWVKDAFRQLLAGVAHAHERGVIHRDIKPGNTLERDATWMVSDFGLGKDLADGVDLTITGEVMGTRPYMSPEQQQSTKAVGPPADVYSLGKVLCKMCTGQTPPPFAYDLAGIPREFHYFISRCCEADPDRRYRDARDALEAFEVLLGATEIIEPPLERAETLVREAAAGVARGDLDALERLDQHLRAFEDEEELYWKVVPRMPTSLLAAYAEHRQTGLKAVLAAFDEHVDGPLPFAFCDVVADFYRVAFEACDDMATRRSILGRLIVMGKEHNRWHVREVLADLLVGISDTSMMMLAADAIDAHPEEAAWHAEEVLGHPLGAPIESALRRTVGLEDAGA